MEKTAFYCSPFITGTNLKSKWNRMAKDYATKAALEREGANLSGLEEPSEVLSFANGHAFAHLENHIF
jgi:hypothetical protein